MTYTAETFLAAIKPYVIEDMKKTGILASLTASQALIESNKGNSGLAQKGNNLFGMKGRFMGQSINMLTTEYYNGKAQRVYADFRKYPSWAESIADHSDLFNRLARYRNLRGCRDWKQATIYVKEDGYATAPNYTQTLQNIIEKYRLYEWDAEALHGTPDEADIPINRNPYREPIVTLRYNSRGNSVRWLQYELNKHGAKLIVDGVFKDKTLNALKMYQASKNLVIDGICGQKTRDALNAEAV